MSEPRVIPWGAISVIVPLLIGVAFAVLAFGDLDATDAWIAKICFVVACLIGGAQAVFLAARRHGRMPYVVVFLACGVIGMLGLAMVNYVSHKQERRNHLTSSAIEQKPQAGAFKLDFKSQIVARMFGESMPAPPPGVAFDARFSFKEFFYEWIVDISPDGELSDVSITIDYLQQDDRISALPDADISELRPRWVSGFQENRKPDYYSKTFIFKSLSKDRAARISVRRSVNDAAEAGGSFGEPEMIQLVDVVPHVQIPTTDPAKEAQRLSKQLSALVKWDGGRGDKKRMPIKSDPGIYPAPGFYLPSVEARCEDEDCSCMSMGQLEVKWGGAITSK